MLQEKVVCSCCAKEFIIYQWAMPERDGIVCGYCRHYTKEFSEEYERKLKQLANGLMKFTTKSCKDKVKKGYQDWYSKWDLAVEQRFNVTLPWRLKNSNSNWLVNWNYIDSISPKMRGIKK